METAYLSIHSVGLIGDDSEKGPFRHVIFKEEQSNRLCDMLVYSKVRPMLWSDLEKAESGGQVPPYRGYIARYNYIDLLIFEGETIEKAFEMQKWKLHIRRKINYIEAEQKRLESLGYLTNLTFEGAIEIGWKQIDQNAQLIKFRFYAGKGLLDWTGWYEISK